MDDSASSTSSTGEASSSMDLQPPPPVDSAPPNGYDDVLAFAKRDWIDRAKRQGLDTPEVVERSLEDINGELASQSALNTHVPPPDMGSFNKVDSPIAAASVTAVPNDPVPAPAAPAESPKPAPPDPELVLATATLAQSRSDRLLLDFGDFADLEQRMAQSIALNDQASPQSRALMVSMMRSTLHDICMSRPVADLEGLSRVEMRVEALGEFRNLLEKRCQAVSEDLDALRAAELKTLCKTANHLAKNEETNQRRVLDINGDGVVDARKANVLERMASGLGGVVKRAFGGPEMTGSLRASLNDVMVSSLSDAEKQADALLKNGRDGAWLAKNGSTVLDAIETRLRQVDQLSDKHGRHVDGAALQSQRGSLGEMLEEAEIDDSDPRLKERLQALGKKLKAVSEDDKEPMLQRWAKQLAEQVMRLLERIFPALKSDAPGVAPTATPGAAPAAAAPAASSAAPAPPQP